MIGIILWAILILFIVTYACPRFWTFMLCVALPVGIAVFTLVSWIQDKLSSR